MLGFSLGGVLSSHQAHHCQVVKIADLENSPDFGGSWTRYKSVKMVPQLIYRLQSPTTYPFLLCLTNFIKQCINSSGRLRADK